MKTFRVSLLTAILSFTLLAHAGTPYLDPYISDPNNTWLGWYDAGLDTLPEYQGWTVTNNPSDTQPMIQNSLLWSNTTVLQYLHWSRTDKYICFPLTHGFVVEFELNIKTSQYVDISSNRWRIGYTVWVADYQGRTFRIGIADTGVILSNDNEWSYEKSSSFVPYNTADGFHVYRFVIQNNIGQLEIDGNPVVWLAAGSINQTTPNRVLFGDTTYHALHESEMTYFRYGLTKKTGDTDGDGFVDLTDLEKVAYNWLSDNCGCMLCCDGADLNHSGRVNMEDLAILSLGWLD